MHNSIEIKNLSVFYQQNEILKNITLSIPNASFVGIIGLNGCGKSTFLKAICGKIDYLGKISENPSSFAHLGQKNNLNFNLSVQDILLMGRFRNLHFTQNFNENDLTLALKMLKNIQCEKLWEKKYKELSGGEQQIIWIVQALLQDLDIFLLDEPTQQLDILNKKKIFDLLFKIVFENNKTVLCVTHDVYNLIPINGFYINLSRPKPILEKISENKIIEEVEFLEGFIK